jgi:hypothetical protein
MKFTTFVVILVTALITAVTSENHNPPCIFCGDGKVVTKPDETASFPGSVDIPCGDLKHGGLCGFIP